MRVNLPVALIVRLWQAGGFSMKSVVEQSPHQGVFCSITVIVNRFEEGNVFQTLIHTVLLVVTGVQPLS